MTSDSRARQHQLRLSIHAATQVLSQIDKIAQWDDGGVRIGRRYQPGYRKALVKGKSRKR